MKMFECLRQGVPQCVKMIVPLLMLAGIVCLCAQSADAKSRFVTKQIMVGAAQSAVQPTPDSVSTPVQMQSPPYSVSYYSSRVGSYPGVMYSASPILHRTRQRFRIEEQQNYQPAPNSFASARNQTASAPNPASASPDNVCQCGCGKPGCNCNNKR